MAEDDERERLRQKIEDLKKNKTEYENMNSNICDAIDKLKSAKQSAKNSKTLLQKYYYDSESASAKATELETEHTNIDNIITKLNTILTTSQRELSSIKTRITSMVDELDNYY